MISKSQISLVKSLQQKKHRKEQQLFLVEGLKAIKEFLNSDYALNAIYAVSYIIPNLPKLIDKQKIFEITNQELEKISALQTPQGILAIFKIPAFEAFEAAETTDLTLVLDGIQDPGNLGTIIRTADWFGFKNIICSKNTVDIYNPKVVQATMGSLSRIKIVYQPLLELLKNNLLPKYGALLNGENVFSIDWPKQGFIIFGSEGNGISEEIVPFITHPVTIPGYGNTESLNVAISTAIFCAEARRNILK